MNNVYFKVSTKVTDPEKKVFIRIRFRSGKIDQATTTGETIKLKYWNLDKQDFTKANFKSKDTLLGRLRKLKDHVLDEAAKSHSYPPGWLNDIVDRYLNPDTYKVVDDSMFHWIECHIADMKIAKRTKYKYDAMLQSLKEYNSALDWADLTHLFYKDYIKSLEKKGLAKNTIFDRIKVIKATAKAGEMAKVNKYNDYRFFKLEPEESDSIYLNDAEISRLSNVNLSRHRHLEETRDLFVVACWVGYRFGDFNKIVADSIKGNFFHFKQAKTKGRIIIPIHPIVKRILEKYNWKLPRPKVNQAFNRELKLIAKASGFRQKEIKGITKGGKYAEEKYEKWQMVSSHTARRSFATNLYIQGVEVITIMKMTGHRTETAFLKYIKVSEEEHARKLEQHWNKLYQNFNSSGES